MIRDERCGLEAWLIGGMVKGEGEVQGLRFSFCRRMLRSRFQVPLQDVKLWGTSFRVEALEYGSLGITELGAILIQVGTFQVPSFEITKLVLWRKHCIIAQPKAHLYIRSRVKKHRFYTFFYLYRLHSPPSRTFRSLPSFPHISQSPSSSSLAATQPPP